jgi:hypothetical protein
LVGELLLQSPNVLTILEGDGVLVGVVADVHYIGQGTKEMRIEIHLVVGGDDRGLVEGLVQA